ncbi:xanthine dehydrogenase accessory protein XdhC [Oceanicola sp. 502str15]|uniref:xanthine dehydrogenase accessory protein XdhC n=1 Tax=Oceanicola sp. 502str15 TaxID=2696061 RepID=UPI002094AB78|nr:xanthine dehydrogenase accessory protein XdhC [Oceanicola sp. 502str15]MCO6381166.1 xanthine dehydrogenase accessory protein XdhC [Oceanicola sp. 502str15]
MSFDRVSLAQAIAAHGPVVRVVVVSAQGSTPRGPGTAMLVWQGGQQGTIGGGALEWEACAMARARLGQAPVTVTLPLGPAMNQCCGGTVTLALESFAEAPPGGAAYARPVAESAPPAPPLAIARALSAFRNGSQTADITHENGWLLEPLTAPRTPVWIWGAGHVGRALAATLAPLDHLALTWADTSADRFPPNPPAPPTPGDLPTLAATAPASAHHIILTYSHSLDFALCDTLLKRPAASIGLIGSATKWARFRTRLAAAGHIAAQISRITCPIGDPSLGKHPQAIAISTAAQLLSMLEKQANAASKGDMTG